MTTLYPVISQRTYPGVDPNPHDASKDIDDCQFITAIWCVTGADPDAKRPDLRAFRIACGKPDAVGVNGANVNDIAKGMAATWPGQPFDLFTTQRWADIMARLEAGDYVSLSVLSSSLPAALRFGFGGSHQVGVVKRDGKLWVANPLAKDGSAPILINPTRLESAARDVGRGWILAIAFPQVPRWQVTVRPPVWGRFHVDAKGVVTRRRVATKGFTAKCAAPEMHLYRGVNRPLLRILDPKRPGQWANRAATLVSAKLRNL